jgi:glutamate synthase domain-containing protein 1
MRKIGLYDPQREHDACGVRIVYRLNGEADHNISMSMEALRNLTRRGMADVDSGDGASAKYLRC